MLSRLRIRGLKAIEDSEDLVLGPINVFIGRNGTGKSSVVDALELLSILVERDAVEAMRPYRRARDLIHDWRKRGGQVASISLEYEFSGDVGAGDRALYEIEVGAPGAGDTLSIMKEDLAIMVGERVDNVVITEFGERYYRVPEIAKPVSLQQKRPRRSKRLRTRQNIRAENPSLLALSRVDDNLSHGGNLIREWLESIVTLRLSPQAVAEFGPRGQHRGRKALDPHGLRTAELLASLTDDERAVLLDKLRFVTSTFSNVVSHDPVGPADQRYFQISEGPKKREIEIPAWVLSEGTRRLTSILALLVMNSPPAFISIEEVENGFDPWTLRFLVEEFIRCSERGVQIAMTTHSPYLMNMLPKECFHFAYRTEKGAKFASLRHEESRTKALSAMGVGDAYVGNLFGWKR